MVDCNNAYFRILIQHTTTEDEKSATMSDDTRTALSCGHGPRYTKRSLTILHV